MQVNDPPVRNAQEAFMMEMRASRMVCSKLNFSVILWCAFDCSFDNLQVQAADSLLKLVSELKQTAIFSGFASLNDHVEQRINEFNQQAEKSDRLLAKIGEEAAASLMELEAHHCSSLQKINQAPWE